MSIKHQNVDTFVNCECDCPLGYTGNNCTTEVAPRRLLNKKAIVKAFPNTNNGNNWDLGVQNVQNVIPDIDITFQDSNLNVIYDSPAYYENVLSGNGAFFEFTITPHIQLINFGYYYLISAWDYDSADQDDFMTNYGFYANVSNKNFPNIITVVNSANNILIDLEVQYEWYYSLKKRISF